MTIMKELLTDDSIEVSKDSLGGGFGPLDTGIYDFTIKHAYMHVAASGAIGLALELATEDGKTLKRTEYMTSRTSKGGKNYYLVDNDPNKKRYLPSFELANNLALLTADKEIAHLDRTEKTIKLWNKEAGKELPTVVPMYMDMIGKKVSAGVLKVVEDKTAKTSDGQYAPTGETREVNEISTFFHYPTGVTVLEAKAGITEPVFKVDWANKWNGQVKNTVKGVSGNGATAGVPSSAGNAPAKKLFA